MRDTIFGCSTWHGSADLSTIRVVLNRCVRLESDWVAVERFGRLSGGLPAKASASGARAPTRCIQVVALPLDDSAWSFDSAHGPVNGGVGESSEAFEPMRPLSGSPAGPLLSDGLSKPCNGCGLCTWYGAGGENVPILGGIRLDARRSPHHGSGRYRICAEVVRVFIAPCPLLNSRRLVRLGLARFGFRAGSQLLELVQRLPFGDHPLDLLLLRGRQLVHRLPRFLADRHLGNPVRQSL